MNIAILGATGSIGTQTLDVVRQCLPHVQVKSLSGFSHMERLAALAEEFHPKTICVPDEAAAEAFTRIYRSKCEIVTGVDGLTACAADADTDVVVNALVGRAGLAPTMAAIEAGKDIALANKETLVTAGELVMKAARAKGIRLTPIDSEHAAIAQCLQGCADTTEVEKLILTASGGAFRDWPRERIALATAADALRHPTWKMGPKITVDCATMMNKGLEIIEAMRLYDMDAEHVEVVIHPQSVVHSMVAFRDGAVMAQLGEPDMRIAILYALTSPKRTASPFPRLDFTQYPALTFGKPDTDKFPCLALAIHAARTGGTLPAVMNHLNERAVHLFLHDKIEFYGIARLIDDAFSSYTVRRADTLHNILEAEAWAEMFFAQRFPEHADIY